MKVFLYLKEVFLSKGENMDAKRLSIKYSGHLCWGNGLNIWKIKADKDVVWPSDKELNEVFRLFDDARFELLQVVECNPREIRIAVPQMTRKITLKVLVAVIASQIP